MQIPAAILQTVRENPVEGTIAVCKYALGVSQACEDWDEPTHEVLLEACAVILSLAEHELIAHLNSPPSLEGHMGSVCNNMQQFLSDTQAEMVGQTSAKKMEALKKGFAVSLANGFGYEFTDGDLSRLQTLINELRGLLQADTKLDDGHKRRLFKRLEALQRELNNKVSEVDNFYALLGDAGVAMGKLGKDAKPFVDRIREIAQIGWKAQARAEQLPGSADNPLLGSDTEPPALS
ncbi:hypothetical protein [Pseudomonas caspiana]|uniref:Uncharacterized protein n=1 Tax=Pseudomonas caspiana TaxID=1451454 RepID=A0A1Y3P812_9PSED|nr:hypothetical protein [Pseudomonas caspiana]OUM73713.1 hypothetical protein AUC60_11600 [Pseudomonas caspiana]